MPTPISRGGAPDFEPAAPQQPEPTTTRPVETTALPPVPSDLAGLKAWLQLDPSSPDRQAMFKQQLAGLLAERQRDASDSAAEVAYRNPIAGSYAITDKRKGIDIRLTVDDPDAQDGVQDLITITEAYSGGLPKGSGSALVVDILQHFGISLRPGGKLVCTSIREESTVRAYTEHMQAKGSSGDSAVGPAAGQTKTGHFLAAIVSRLGLEIAGIEWPTGSVEQIEITAITRNTTRGAPPALQSRLLRRPQQGTNAERRSPPED